MKSKLILKFICCFIICFISVYAETADVQLHFFPETISLAPGEEAEILLLIKNNSAKEVKDLQLTWHSPPGMLVKCDEVFKKNLSPTNSWNCKLTVTKNIITDETINVEFQLRFKTGATGSPSAEIVNKLEIKNRAYEEINKIATVEIQTTLEKLQEHQQGIMYVIVRNITDIPITLKKPNVNYPDFINVTILNQKSDIVLSPQQAYSYEVMTTLKNAIQPGKHLLLFEINFEWVRAGHKYAGNLFSHHELNAGVLGESEILKLIGVPSFLLLPGFLMIIIFRAIWNKLRSGAKISLEATSSNFWFIAITLSLLTAPVYPLLTGLFGSPRNYLEGYGLIDVFQVWFGSLIVSALSCIALITVIDLHKRLQQIRKVPSQNDAPFKIIRKLDLNNKSFQLKQVMMKQDTKNEYYFVLDEMDDWAWISPAVGIKWGRNSTAADRQRFSKEMDDISRWDELLKSLERAHKENLIVDIGWIDSFSITKPHKIKLAEDTKIFEQARGFIEFIE